MKTKRQLQSVTSESTRLIKEGNPKPEVQHTPMPCKLVGAELRDANGKSIALLCGNESDAAFIVRAVNAYEKDQALIKELLELAKDYRGDLINHLGIWTKERIEQIIARAEGK